MSNIDVLWTKLDGSLALEILALILALVLVFLLLKRCHKPDLLRQVEEFLKKR